MLAPNPPALSCRDVSVNYGPVAALIDVSVDFAPGAIHAVVGQNGAGKTTFARVVAGLVQPARGVVEVGGATIRTAMFATARAAGVELVHQSFALPPSFTVAEAMEFGAPGTGGVFSRRGLGRALARASAESQCRRRPSRRGSATCRSRPSRRSRSPGRWSPRPRS